MNPALTCVKAKHQLFYLIIYTGLPVQPRLLGNKTVGANIFRTA